MSAREWLGGKGGWLRRRAEQGHTAGAMTVGEQLRLLPGAEALQEKLAEESARERAAQEPTALLMVGLDGMDELAESAGAGALELVQLTVARALRAALPRRSDLLARLDGETFAAVLPGTDLPGALRVGARLRWSVLRLDLAHPRRELVTVSFGLAVECGAIAQSGMRMLAAAQGELRKAKEAGGDRTEHTVLDGAMSAAMGVLTAPMRSLRAGVAGAVQ